MKLEGRTIIVNKSADVLTKLLKEPAQYESLMPDSLQVFTANDNGFEFELKGMPKIGLNIEQVVDNESVRLASANPSLNFTLSSTLSPLNDSQTQVQLFFEGKFNPLVKMMVEKPLNKFIASLTDKIETL